jgi:hypothetical protein
MVVLQVSMYWQKSYHVKKKHDFGCDPERTIADVEDDVWLNITTIHKVSNQSNWQVYQEQHYKESKSSQDTIKNILVFVILIVFC